MFQYVVDSRRRACYTQFCNDDTEQIHDETARQSRSAFGICLSIVSPSSDLNLEGSDSSRGLLVFTEAGSQAGKARDCTYSTAEPPTKTI